ncbi:MAG TPA: 3-oxoacyl-[acyl-carrier-protein] synthase III C-terminal domain-containing protein [Ktedonobacterales bacterium]|nr:3-oxoacyl-[acyl-carrier-protein] synthase III C-terminal domain-containing protein [Ktedonobacterales bacterium]
MIIESIGAFLPERVVTTDEVLRGCATKLVFPLERITGIRSRRMAGEAEFSIDLARRAVERCFQLSRYRPEDIDIVICSNISRCDGPNSQFTFEPSTAVRLSALVGCTHALTFDIANACAGTFTAFALADGLLKSGKYHRALVASGEYITCLTRTAQREIEGAADPRLACLTLGDSGVATILELGQSKTVGFQQLDICTLGRYSDCCTAGASHRSHGAVMLTDALRLTAASLTEGLPLAMAGLAQNGWSPDNAQHIILHQTSRTTLVGGMRAINHAVGREACHVGNMIDHLADRGNTATNSHMLALYENMVSGRIGSGETVLFGVTGSGLTVGSAVYTLDDLPERVRLQVNGRGGYARQTATQTKRAPMDAHAPGIRIACAATSSTLAEEGHTARMLAHIAAERCLERWPGDREAIPLLLYAGVYRDDFMCEPAMAALLTADLDLDHAQAAASVQRRLAFDVFNGSLGFLQGCYLASQLMRARGFDCAMIATGEIENNATVFPARMRGLVEMGSALVLETHNGSGGFGGFLFRSFVEHLDALFTRTNEEGGKTYLECAKSEDLEERYLTCIAQTVREFLAAEEIVLDQVNVVFPPQISSSFISRLATILGLDRSRFVDACLDNGDAFTSSLPLALEQAREHGSMNAGDIGLMIAVGSGVQVGCALYRFL